MRSAAAEPNLPKQRPTTTRPKSAASPAAVSPGRPEGAWPPPSRPRLSPPARDPAHSAASAPASAPASGSATSPPFNHPAIAIERPATTIASTVTPATTRSSLARTSPVIPSHDAQKKSAAARIAAAGPPPSSHTDP